MGYPLCISDKPKATFIPGLLQDEHTLTASQWFEAYDNLLAAIRMHLTHPNCPNYGDNIADTFDYHQQLPHKHYTGHTADAKFEFYLLHCMYIFTVMVYHGDYPNGP